MHDDLLESRKSRYFMAVMRAGSIRAAAEALGADPSVVSRAIAVMESDCGMALFERGGRGVVPTDAARLIAGFAGRQRQLWRDLEGELNEMRAGRGGHVDVASGEGFLELLCRDVLPVYWEDHPNVDVAVDVRPTAGIVQALLADAVHVGVALQPPADARLCSHASSRRPFRVLVRREHALALLGRPLALADLQPYAGAALQSGFGAQQRIATAAAAEEVTLRCRFTTASFKSLEYFALSGAGYALTPMVDSVARLRRQGLACLPVINPVLNQTRVHVLSRAGRPLSAAAQQLITLLSAHIGPPELAHTIPPGR